MFARILVLVFALLSFNTMVFAGETRRPANCKFFNALSGGADHDSAALNMMPYNYGSFHVKWSGLGGTINAVVKVQGTNDPDCSTCWLDKPGGTFNVSGASGTGAVAYTGGTLTEAYYRVHWEAGTTTGGSITGFCMAKE